MRGEPGEPRRQVAPATIATRQRGSPGDGRADRPRRTVEQRRAELALQLADPGCTSLVADPDGNLLRASPVD